MKSIHNAIYFQKWYNIPSILTDHFRFFLFVFYIYLFYFTDIFWVFWDMLQTEAKCESTARAPQPYWKSMCAKYYTTALIDRIGFITMKPIHLHWSFICLNITYCLTAFRCIRQRWCLEFKSGKSYKIPVCIAILCKYVQDRPHSKSVCCVLCKIPMFKLRRFEGFVSVAKSAT